MTDIADLKVAPPGNPTLEEFFRVACAVAITNQDNGEVRPELVTAWVTAATFEDSTADWNPADTTYFEAGATPYNSFGPGNRFHVWDYASAEQGISAFVSTLGGPEYAGLRRVMLDPTTSEAMIKAAIATSPWTGVTNDPHLYDNVVPEPDRIVHGPGGWPYAKVEPPAPAPAPTEEAKVESAIDAQSGATVTDARDGKLTAAKTKLEELKVHIAELDDILSK